MHKLRRSPRSVPKSDVLGAGRSMAVPVPLLSSGTFLRRTLYGPPCRASCLSGRAYGAVFGAAHAMLDELLLLVTRRQSQVELAH